MRKRYHKSVKLKSNDNLSQKKKIRPCEQAIDCAGGGLS
jgi:hypothetical protein